MKMILRRMMEFRSSCSHPFIAISGYHGTVKVSAPLEVSDIKAKIKKSINLGPTVEMDGRAAEEVEHLGSC